ncbi:suppressor of kinetochore protein mutant [Tyrophagus putrescentiae]|nr:suppressor of kinetochore protein mutant [Tyrophagus putrescentiae]
MSRNRPQQPPLPHLPPASSSVVSSSSNKPMAPPSIGTGRTFRVKEEDPSVETPISIGSRAFTPNKRSATTATATGPPSQPAEATVNLASNDGRVFPVRVEVARSFGIVRNMIDHCIIEKDSNDTEPVPLARVSGPILQLAITWAEQHYARHPTPANVKVKVEKEEEEKGGTGSNKDDNLEIYYKRPTNRRLPRERGVTATTTLEPQRSMDDLEYWDRQFLGSLTPGKLQDLLEAANYLDSQELLESTCKMVAQMIKGVLDGDGPDGVADFVQVPQKEANEEPRKKPASGSGSGGSQPVMRPAITVNHFINSRSWQQSKPPEKSRPGKTRPIKREGDDEGVRWAGLVLPQRSLIPTIGGRERNAEVSVQGEELRAEVADAFAAE